MSVESGKKYYTTQLGAGLGLVEETKILLDMYQPGMTVTELYDIALDSGCFPSVTARRLRNIIAECFSPRYLKTGCATHLKPLINIMSSQSISQVFLIHTALANQVLEDFIIEVYWERYIGGYDEISVSEAREFVTNAVNEGKTQKPWAESVIKRVSSYVVGCCADYGLLSSGRASKRQILPVRIQSDVALYLAYWLHLSGLGDNAVVNHTAWKLFGLEPIDVREELKKMAKNNWLIVQSAGEVTRISWQFNTMEEVINVISNS